MWTPDLIDNLRSAAGVLARQGNHEARDLMNMAADRLQRMADRTADSDDALIKKLLAIAEIGIVNQKNDVPVILDAAERIEELSERVAIMTENLFPDAAENKHEFLKKTFHIGPGADVDPQEPRVMTLEEAIKAVSENGGFVWMEQKAHPLCDAHISPINSIYDCPSRKFKDYGKKFIPKKNSFRFMWRCWTSWPTNEQREATPWN